MAGHRWHRRLLTTVAGFAGVVIAIYAATRIVAFVELFGIFKDHAGVRNTQAEIAAYYNNSSSDSRSPMVPKIIHQVFHNWHDENNDTIPAKWQPSRQSCLDLNPDWEQMLWSAKRSEEFIEKEYPWFLSAYKSYKYPVQRVDVIKYFVLHHYGGIYIDLDNGCTANLEPLTYYPAFTTDGGLGALSNNIMGGTPEHPFFVIITENLIRWKLNYLLPYVTVMLCSGQWFLTAMWEKYHSDLSPDSTVRGFANAKIGWKPLHRILMDMRPGADPWVFFNQVAGESWADWDYRILKAIGDHIVLIILLVVVFICVLVRFCMNYRARSRATYIEYQKLDI
ncbi:hypothetical protein EYB26_000008 [Talaromyces marneffei]|uniref:uncharacterized protein n=1 Tax=Talaromyces marneffei TaxID=37727 RepID=UPI0012A86E1F|nr:uncharacterized protein EYB26_000008 [Talaromyces marneffei]QGA12364.1 hypothetical protein EYB26_000008 [Talaromyces marneffei]